MNQPQARYHLDPPVLNCDMDTLVHNMVQGVVDALWSAEQYILHLEDNPRGLWETQAVNFLKEKLKLIEASAWWTDINDTANRWEARQ